MSASAGSSHSAAALAPSPQGGTFPLLAALLRQQQLRRPEGGPAAGLKAVGVARAAAAGESAAQELDAATAEAALRISKLLLGEAPAGDDGSGSDGEGAGDSLADWVAGLPRLAPLAAAQRRQEELKGQLEAAVEASIEAEDAYNAAAGGAAGGPLQQQALAALERAADLQKASGAWAWGRSVCALAS